MRRAALLLLLAGCGDPYRDKLIDALGDEDPRIPKGEFHRPGQPCVACHSKYGGAPEFAIGGTLFNNALPGQPPFMVDRYTVRIVDSEGQSRDVVSNRCGNFYIKRSEWDPAFPLRAELYGPNPNDPQKLIQVNVMSSRIARDGSCAGCHIGAPSAFSPGVVYVPQLPKTVLPPGPNDCAAPWLGPDPRIPDPTK